MLNDKQIELLQIIGRFGYLDSKILEAHFNITQQSLNKRIKILADKKLLKIDKTCLAGYNNKSLYFLTEKAREMFQLPQPKFRFSTYQHDMLVAMVLIKLSHLHNAIFKTEREIRAELGFATKEHIPDGIIFIKKNDKDFTIALEIETTKKKKDKLKKNFDFYYTMSKYNLVWYYCNNLTFSWVKNNNKYEKIKTLNLDKITKENENE